MGAGSPPSPLTLTTHHDTTILTPAYPVCTGKWPLSEFMFLNFIFMKCQHHSFHYRYYLLRNAVPIFVEYFQSLQLILDNSDRDYQQARSAYLGSLQSTVADKIFVEHALPPQNIAARESLVDELFVGVEAVRWCRRHFLQQPADLIACRQNLQPNKCFVVTQLLYLPNLRRQFVSWQDYTITTQPIFTKFGGQIRFWW